MGLIGLGGRYQNGGVRASKTCQKTEPIENHREFRGLASLSDLLLNKDR